MNDNPTRLINNKLYYGGIIVLVIISSNEILDSWNYRGIGGTQVNWHFRWLLSDLIIYPSIGQSQTRANNKSLARSLYLKKRVKINVSAILNRTKMAIFSSHHRMLVSLLLTLVQIQAKVFCYQYKVGDLDAWGIPTSANPQVYTKWSKYHNLTIGDSFCKFTLLSTS